MERRFLSDNVIASLDFSKSSTLENGSGDIDKKVLKLADDSEKVIYRVPYFLNRELAKLYFEDTDGFHKRQMIRYMDNKNPSNDELADELMNSFYFVYFYVHDDGEIDVEYENHCNTFCNSMIVRLVGENVSKLFEIIKKYLIEVYGSFNEYKGYTMELDNGLMYRNKRSNKVPFNYEVECLIRGNYCVVDSDIKRIYLTFAEVEFYESDEHIDIERRYLSDNLTEFLNKCTTKDEKLKLIEDVKEFLISDNYVELGKLNLLPSQYLEDWND